LIGQIGGVVNYTIRVVVMPPLRPSDHPVYVHRTATVKSRMRSLLSVKVKPAPKRLRHIFEAAKDGGTNRKKRSKLKRIRGLERLSRGRGDPIWQIYA